MGVKEHETLTKESIMKTAFFSFIFAVACICAIFVLHNRIDGTQTDNSVQLVQTAILPGPLLTDNAPVWLAEADDDDGFGNCSACWFRV